MKSNLVEGELTDVAQRKDQTELPFIRPASTAVSLLRDEAWALGGTGDPRTIDVVFFHVFLRADGAYETFLTFWTGSGSFVFVCCLSSSVCRAASSFVLSVFFFFLPYIPHHGSLLSPVLLVRSDIFFVLWSIWLCRDVQFCHCKPTSKMWNLRCRASVLSLLTWEVCACTNTLYLHLIKLQDR